MSEQPLKVWTRFTVTKGTDTIKFRIVELPQHRMKDFQEFIGKYFVTEETLFKGAAVAESKEALAELNAILEASLADGSMHFAVCCLDDNNDNDIGVIIGASLMVYIPKDDEFELEPETKPIKKLMEMVAVMKEMFSMRDLLKVDTYYDGKGVVVHPKYRGCGIAQQLLHTRRLVCKEHNVPATVALMTAYGSQIAAKRDNWETIYEFDFHEFGDKVGVDFKDSPKTAKLMMAKAI